MATPSLSKHTIPGALGDLLIDVRTGDRRQPRPTVLVLHGFKGFKDWGMFPVLADRLARSGITAVSYNSSGSGVDDQGEFSLPEAFRHNTFAAELADFETMVAAITDGRLGFPPPTSLGVVGHSRGGGVAILGGAKGLVDALVTWAAVSTIRRWSEDAMNLWRRRGELTIRNARTGQVLPIGTELLDEIEQAADGPLDILAAATRVSCPWLLVHGADDPTVPPSEAADLSGAARADNFTFLEIPGAGHTFGATHPLSAVGPQLEEALTATVSWFARYL